MNNQKGYTLMEMLTVIVLSGLLFLMLIEVFNMHVGYYANEYERTHAQQTAKNLYMDMVKEIERAHNISIGCNGYCISIDSNEYRISGSELLKNGEKVAVVETVDGHNPFLYSGYVEARFDIVYKSARSRFYLIASERINAS